MKSNDLLGLTLALYSEGMTKGLDRVGVSLYLQEAYELADSLLYRLDRLSEAQKGWPESRAIGDAQARVRPDKFDREAFNAAGRITVRTQSEVFDEVESFLAAWARLSLLFFPTPAARSPNARFSRDRGTLLRTFLRLGDDSPLADRVLRDAWMHTDERFDDAWLHGRLGNRQQFVHTRDVEVALAHSVRVLDMESLTIYVRDQSGHVHSRSLPAFKSVIEDLLLRREEAFRERFHELPVEQGHED